MAEIEGDSPTARALGCLLLLQDHPGITADALGERLGVTERAARRYVGLLRDAGIPVESVRGPYGGYRLGRGLRLPPLTFSAAEALGLVMAVLDGHHAAGDDDDPVGSALAKILRGLPAPVAEQAAAVRRAAAAAPDRGAARPDPAVTTTLVEACSSRRRVRIGYRSESGKEWEAAVDPWAVVVRHGRWYLLCLDRRADDRRAYRVDRVTAVDLLDEDAPVPDGLDPVAELEDHLAVGWEYATEVMIDLPLDQARRRVPRALGRLEADGEQRTRLTGSTSNPHWYAAQLVELPGYRILGGPELQHVARELGQRLASAAEGA